VGVGRGALFDRAIAGHLDAKSAGFGGGDRIQATMVFTSLAKVMDFLVER